MQCISLGIGIGIAESYAVGQSEGMFYLPGLWQQSIYAYYRKLQKKWAICSKNNFQTFCNLEVKIRIESLACRNARVGIANFLENLVTFKIVSEGHLLSLLALLEFQWPWTCCCRQKFEKFGWKDQMFPKHFQTSLLCLHKQNIAVSTRMRWAPEIKKSWFCFLSFSAGRLDMKLKQNGRKSSKSSYFSLISLDGIAPNLTFLVLITLLCA